MEARYSANVSLGAIYMILFLRNVRKWRAARSKRPQNAGGLILLEKNDGTNEGAIPGQNNPARKCNFLSLPLAQMMCVNILLVNGRSGGVTTVPYSPPGLTIATASSQI